MKKTLLAMTLACVVAAGSAQEENPYQTYKNDIAFGILGAGELKSFGFPVPALSYRRFFTNSSVRVVMGGYIATDNQSGANFQYYEEQNALSIRAGYQYLVWLGRFTPHIGLDAFAGYYDWSYRDHSGWNNFVSESTTVTRSFGLSPNIALKYWFAPKLSVSLEMRTDLGYKEQRDLWSTNDPFSGNASGKSVSTGLMTHVAPISSFMVSFHF
ncbi:MAG: hypothetical protein Kow0075_15100 [Salibacteraceae bacterium]